MTPAQKTIRAHAANGPASNYVALGIVTTSAPQSALLVALSSLRGQVDVRLPHIAEAANADGSARYRVEVALPDGVDAFYAIEIWKRIRHALLAEFPVGRADAIQIIDT